MVSPSSNVQRFYIKILEEIYEENIILGKDKVSLVLVGEGTDKNIIASNRSVSTSFKTYDTMTVGNVQVLYSNLIND